MKFKKGDKVVVPTGTPVSTFQGSLLDKNPFRTSPMEYDAVGIIESVSGKFVHVDIWDTGRSYPWIANIPKKHLTSFKPCNKIFWFDYEVGICRVLDVDNLPSEGAREYDISASYTTIENKSVMFHDVGWTVWAMSRKEALSMLKLACEVEKIKDYKAGVCLARKNQTPFWRGLFAKEIAAHKKT